jgi:hypothetical protein
MESVRVDALVAEYGVCVPLERFAEEMGFTTAELKKTAFIGRQQGVETGISQTETGWMIDIHVFRRNVWEKRVEPHVRYIPSHWDGNDLLGQKGLFYLRDVVELLPFNANQLRYQAQKHADSRRETGIFRPADSRGYLVDMEIFSPWLSQLWEKEK